MLSRTWFIFKKPETWGENKPVISSLLKWLGWVQRLTWVLQGINSPAWTLVGGEGEVRPALLEFFPESTIKRMDLESVIHCEVSQKEKNKYRILQHEYEI